MSAAAVRSANAGHAGASRRGSSGRCVAHTRRDRSEPREQCDVNAAWGRIESREERCCDEGGHEHEPGDDAEGAAVERIVDAVARGEPDPPSTIRRQRRRRRRARPGFLPRALVRARARARRSRADGRLPPSTRRRRSCRIARPRPARARSSSFPARKSAARPASRRAACQASYAMPRPTPIAAPDEPGKRGAAPQDGRREREAAEREKPRRLREDRRGGCERREDDECRRGESRPENDRRRGACGRDGDVGHPGRRERREDSRRQQADDRERRHEVAGRPLGCELTCQLPHRGDENRCECGREQPADPLVLGDEAPEDPLGDIEERSRDVQRLGARPDVARLRDRLSTTSRTRGSPRAGRGRRRRRT